MPMVAMRTPLRPRDSDKAGEPSKRFAVAAVIVIAAFTLAALGYFLYSRRRPSTRPAKQQQQQHQPGDRDRLPSLFSLSAFRRPRRTDYSSSLQDQPPHSNSISASQSDGEMRGASDPERQAGVDRHTSVRSVMSLPAYTPAARENERILGREGERAGMDNVIELPETAEDDEALRNDEMESLYQIRLARRAEAVEREARRQARREARARGDHLALAEIRRRAEEAADLSVSQMLIAEHQSRNRERRVSSVAYGDLGVARHDGTRLRANSTESDHRPLLDSAASISGHRDSHQRNLSVSSIPYSTADSRTSDDFNSSHTARSRSGSHSRSNNGSPTTQFYVVPLAQDPSPHGSRAPSPSPVLPQEQAPAYEDPPNYESPIQTRAPQLPRLEPMPSITVITTEPTPVEPRSQSSFR